MALNDIKVVTENADGSYSEKVITSLEPNEVLKSDGVRSLYFGKINYTEILDRPVNIQDLNQSDQYRTVSVTEKNLWDPLLTRTLIIVPGLTSLSIDGSLGEYYIISLSNNSTFVLNNVVPGRIYYFLIKNISASTITIMFPNTADIKIKNASSFTITADTYTEVSMVYNGVNRCWQTSEELNGGI